MIHSFNTIDEDENGEISRDEFIAAAFDFFFGYERTEISKKIFWTFTIFFSTVMNKLSSYTVFFYVINIRK